MTVLEQGFIRLEDLPLERCIEIYKAAEAADKHMKTLNDQPSISEDIDAASRSGKPPRRETHTGFVSCSY